MFRLYDAEGRNSTDNETAMDGGYYSRSDILPWQNSPSSNIQGGILLDDGCRSYSVLYEVIELYASVLLLFNAKCLC